MSSIRMSFSFLILLFVASVALAEQTAHHRAASGHSISYEFKFTHANGKRSVLGFYLNKAVMDQANQQFTEQSRERLNANTKKQAKELFHQVQKEYQGLAREKFRRYIQQRQQQLPSAISIELKNNGNGLSIQSNGEIPNKQAQKIIDQLYAELNDKWKELNSDYVTRFKKEIASKIEAYYVDTYKQHNYVIRFNSSDRSNFDIRIDFVAVADKYTQAMRPVAEAIEQQARGMSKRDKINLALTFIQSIPYDTLQSREGHGSLGFVAPPTLLDINKGDCDTKATALASILRNLYPDLNMLMVLIPEHAFLAVELQANAQDTAFSYAGRKYVVLEAAGPALTPVGSAYPESLRYLSEKKSQIIEVLVFD